MNIVIILIAGARRMMMSERRCDGVGRSRRARPERGAEAAVPLGHRRHGGPVDHAMMMIMIIVMIVITTTMIT